MLFSCFSENLEKQKLLTQKSKKSKIILLFPLGKFQKSKKATYFCFFHIRQKQKSKKSKIFASDLWYIILQLTVSQPRTKPKAGPELYLSPRTKVLGPELYLSPEPSLGASPELYLSPVHRALDRTLKCT